MDFIGDMFYHNFASLNEMHIEITNRCNAACPMCSRNKVGGETIDNLKPTEWTQKDAEKIFDSRFENLKNILFCGTHGDPAVASECLQIVETIRKNTASATIEFFSNGSVRNPSWWQDLAKLLNFKQQRAHYRDHDIAIFSIDGLEDTNHIYRRRTQFHKIIENAQAFIAAGGVARWDFLVFKHNEHQVDEAQKLAKQLGFKQFRIRKTSRFVHSPAGVDRYPVHNNKGELEYYIEPPTQEQYLNSQQGQYLNLVNQQKQNEVAAPQKINCLYKNNFGRIYVNAQAQLFPFCFISIYMYFQKGQIFNYNQEKIIKKYGEGFNDLRVHSWDSILNHPWLSKDLVSSWSQPESALLRCRRTCTEGINPILSQTQNVSL